MMVVAKFGDVLHKAQEAGGEPKPKEVDGLADAIMTELKSKGVVTFLPGTVKGTCPPGGPLAKGSASNGTISGLTGPSLAATMRKKMNKSTVTPQLIAYATGMVEAVKRGKVTFKAGTVTGTCANSSNSPGPFTGQALKGKISGISGPDMAGMIARGMGKPTNDKLVKQCNAIAKYIQDQAEITFALGKVSGTAPSGGGPLATGKGNSGKFS